MNTRCTTYALIASGGCVGAILRFVIDAFVPSLLGTLTVNFLGCVAMGVLMYESIYIGAFRPETRIFFGIGVIGAFTTFSAFAVQSFSAGPSVGIVNILASLTLGITGIFAGRFLISYQGRI